MRERARRRVRYSISGGLGEPVVQRGPFVMTTEAEVAEAFADARAGRLAPLPGR